MADSLYDKIIRLYNQLKAEIDEKADISLLDGYVAKNELATVLRYSTVQKTVVNGSITAEDRSVNAITSSVDIPSLEIVFPPKIQGKLRDFGIRIDLSNAQTTKISELVFPVGIAIELEDGAEPPESFEAGKWLIYLSET